jgi:hypothetical protein
MLAESSLTMAGFGICLFSYGMVATPAFFMFPPSHYLSATPFALYFPSAFTLSIEQLRIDN